MDFNVTCELLSGILGLSDNVAGAIATRLNLTVNDVFVVRDLAGIANESDDAFAVLILLLADSVNDGSTCLSLSGDHIAAKSAAIGFPLEKLLAKAASLPEALAGMDRPIVLDDGHLYFQRHHRAERSLNESIAKIIRASRDDRADPELVRKSVESVMASTRYPLEPLQTQALVGALLSDFFIISGGPGTGKTTIVLAFLRSLLRMEYDPGTIRLAAPTGRAAKRMTESIAKGLRNDVSGLGAESDARALEKVEAVTLHRLLKYNPSRGGFKRNAENLLQAKVIVVDEVSMVDISLMAAFMRAVPPGCKLLFLGDQHQLPPVDAGAVLADLMPAENSRPVFTRKFADTLMRCLPEPMERFTAETRNAVIQNMNVADEPPPSLMTNHVTVLSVSKRFQKEIAELGEHVRNMDSAKVADFLSARRLNAADGIAWTHLDGAYLLPADSIGDWGNLLLSWVDENLFRSGESYAKLIREAEEALSDSEFEVRDCHAEPLRRLFAKVAASRILCLTHEGKFGVGSINAKISAYVRKRLGERGNDGMSSGAVVMVLENSRHMDLYNGDVGILLRNTNSGQLRAVFERERGFATHSIHTLPANKPAFATTVHKSQGSEFDRILMPLPEDPSHRLLTREIIYTGLTRARKGAFIVSSDEALTAAVSRKTERFSGLRFAFHA